MLDYVLLVITLLFLVVQGIVSCQLCTLVARGKKEGGTVVSDFWWDGMPYFFLAGTAIMLACAIKTEDMTLLMLPIVLSVCVLFDMHILYFDGDKMVHYYFLLQKSEGISLKRNGNFVVLEAGEKTKVIRLPGKKMEKLVQAYRRAGKDL